MVALPVEEGQRYIKAWSVILNRHWGLGWKSKSWPWRQIWKTMTAFENMIGESEIYHIGKYLQQCIHRFPFVKRLWESESDHHIENQPWPRWPCRCRSWDPRRSPARCRSRGWTPGGSDLLARWAGAPTLTIQWVWWLWLATKRCIHNIVVANLAGILRTKSCDSGSLSRVSRARMKRHAREGSEVWYLRFKRYYHGDHHVDGWN